MTAEYRQMGGVCKDGTFPQAVDSVRPGRNEKRPQSRHSLLDRILLGRGLPSARIDCRLSMVHGHIPDRWRDNRGDGTDDGVLGNSATLVHQEIARAFQRTPRNQAQIAVLVRCRKEANAGVGASSSGSPFKCRRICRMDRESVWRPKLSWSTLMAAYLTTGAKNLQDSALRFS